MPRVLPAVAIAFVSACAPQARAPAQDPAAERVALMDVERAFARESVEKGTAAAFRDNLADEAVEIGGGQPLHGRDAIAKALEDPAGGPRTVLDWAPEDAAVSGDLGYTWGRYTATTDGKAVHGKYMSVWRRAPGGSWKVIADIGTSDTPAKQ
jgi:ketosteroid isomerase-like protein